MGAPRGTPPAKHPWHAEQKSRTPWPKQRSHRNHRVAMCSARRLAETRRGHSAVKTSKADLSYCCRAKLEIKPVDVVLVKNERLAQQDVVALDLKFAERAAFEALGA